MPQPVCQPGTYSFPDLSSVAKDTEYIGGTNASWVSYGNVVPSYGTDLSLQMPRGTVGAILASTFYVWYGRVTATFFATAGTGVVTIFSLLSNTGDEVGHYIMGDDPKSVAFYEFPRSRFTGVCKFHRSPIGTATISLTDRQPPA